MLSWGGCSFLKVYPGPLLRTLPKGLVLSTMLLILTPQGFPQDQIGSWALNDLHVPLKGIASAAVHSQPLLEVNIIHEKV